MELSGPQGGGFPMFGYSDSWIAEFNIRTSQHRHPSPALRRASGFRIRETRLPNRGNGIFPCESRLPIANRSRGIVRRAPALFHWSPWGSPREPVVLGSSRRMPLGGRASQVITRLQVHPQARRRPQRFCQIQRRVCSDATLCLDEFVELGAGPSKRDSHPTPPSELHLTASRRA